MKYFDGMIVSSDIQRIKPDPEIYRALFSRFSLKPEECYFIDDREENVAAGEALGMKGFRFEQDAEVLTDALRGEGVTV